MIYHVPVLVKECIDLLQLRAGGIYVDATLGGGGHSHAMLDFCSDIQLYVFDQDPDAINYAKVRLQDYKNQVHYFNENFENLRNRLALERINKIDGILMDIGVSNYQISESSRGFSFMHDADLDMRMDKQRDLTAEQVVNELSQDELKKIFFELGEENLSAFIAKEIVYRRTIKRISRTRDLADIVETCVRKSTKGYIEPSNITKSKARIFQAIRIYVNDELNLLSKTLKESVSLLNNGGRIAVISWHSLEDRIVKQYFVEEHNPCTCPKDLPICLCGKKPRLKIITKKPIVPGVDEISDNSNAKSAKLRVAERIGRV